MYIYVYIYIYFTKSGNFPVIISLNLFLAPLSLFFFQAQMNESQIICQFHIGLGGCRRRREHTYWKCWHTVTITLEMEGSPQALQRSRQQVYIPLSSPFLRQPQLRPQQQQRNKSSFNPPAPVCLFVCLYPRKHKHMLSVITITMKQKSFLHCYF